jgi:hypothetical protein
LKEQEIIEHLKKESEEFKSLFEAHHDLDKTLSEIDRNKSLRKKTRWPSLYGTSKGPIPWAEGKAAGKSGSSARATKQGRSGRSPLFIQTWTRERFAIILLIEERYDYEKQDHKRRH